MTPEQRAERLCLEIPEHTGYAIVELDAREAKDIITTAIEEAVAAERERCAVIADEKAGPLGEEPLGFWGGQRDACFAIAAAIRREP